MLQIQQFPDLTQTIGAVIGLVVIALLYLYYKLRIDLPAPGNVIGLCKFIILDKGEEISGDTVEVDRDYVIPYFEGVIDDTLDGKEKTVFQKYKDSFGYGQDGNYPLHAYAVRSSQNLDPETQGRNLIILTGDISKYAITTGGGFSLPFHRTQQYTIVVSSRVWRAGPRHGFNVIAGCIVDPKTIVAQVIKKNPGEARTVKRVQPLVETTLDRQLGVDDHKMLSDIIPEVRSFSEHDRSVKQFKAQFKQSEQELTKQVKENQNLRAEKAHLTKALERKSLTGEGNVSTKDTIVERTERYLGVIFSFIGFVLCVNFLPNFVPELKTQEAGAIGIILGAVALWILRR